MNKRKKLIIEHVLALFLEKGIQQTSIQDIIERASISKGTFYNYFPSKNECIAALLAQLYTESNLSRTEIIAGKDASNLDLLVDQISNLLQYNHKRGLHTIIEEIIHSKDAELRRLVLQHRLSEFEWLAERLIDVYGEELRPHAFESSVIFHGILHMLQFTRKVTNQTLYDNRQITSTVFRYMPNIIHSLLHDHTAVLDIERLSDLKGNLFMERIDQTDVIELLEQLSSQQQLTKAQTDLTQALIYEFQQAELRDSVIYALLQPLSGAFEESSNYRLTKEVISMIWYYLKQR